ncbi:MAG TPA: glutathione S-transferase [Rhodospirillaceae bacterium]|nr:glutathione S-transferase [Rhodospirillaceae bacterium]
MAQNPTPMLLRFSPTSPFARKVLVLAEDIGLREQIQLVPTNPWAADTDLPACNPLGMVPALGLGSGEWLYDSPVICAYLDSLHSGRRRIPDNGPSRWTALRRQALGDGLMEAGLKLRIETTMRPAALRWADWCARQDAKIRRALQALEGEVLTFPREDWTIGEITIAVALGYLDFRWPGHDWLRDCPQLAVWSEHQKTRPCLQSTMPVE